jgi:hypothetical protein
VGGFGASLLIDLVLARAASGDPAVNPAVN